MKLNVLTTGNELMAGDIIDSNSAMMAEIFEPLGWRIHKKVTVGDDLPLLCQEIDQLCADGDVLLINGGLGPTVDDLTAEAMAQVCERPIQDHPEALAHLQAWCQQRNQSLSKANLKQTRLPADCAIIANGRGSAVGIRMEHRGCLMLATPGVPSELKQMLSEEIVPLLRERFVSDHIRTLRLGVFGLGESTVQERLSDAIPDWPADIELGFRASMPVLEVKLTARGENLGDVLSQCRLQVEDALSHHVIGELPTSLPGALIEACRQRQLSVCAAESCTGGLIASQLTSVPGASDVFPGGIVSYSNGLKKALLGVSASDLEQAGAVSETVARQMLSGALKACGADIGVAVTGIAGPGGGSPDKPVGTVWIAWGSHSAMQSQRLVFPFERAAFQQWVSALALDLLRRHVVGVDEFPQLMQRFCQPASSD